MPSPIVCIIGRPNVGKSTLFNRIVGRRVAVVDPTPGVTRDRLYAETECMGRRFAIVDTAVCAAVAPSNVSSRERPRLW